MTDYNKCGQCEWLSDEKCIIGNKCVNPDKPIKSSTSMWKYPSGKACKLFKEELEKND